MQNTKYAFKYIFAAEVNIVIKAMIKPSAINRSKKMSYQRKLNYKYPQQLAVHQYILMLLHCIVRLNGST